MYSLIILPTALTKFCWHCNFGEISPKSLLSPNSPTFRGPCSWVNLFPLIISSTTLAKFRQIRHFRQTRRFRRFCQHFRSLNRWVNLFDVIISSTTLPRFCQNRIFRQIRRFCKHFWELVGGLIYLLLWFRQQPWRKFRQKSSFSPNSPLSRNSPTF